MTKRRNSEDLQQVLLEIQKQDRQKPHSSLEELLVLTQELSGYIQYLYMYYIHKGGSPGITDRELYMRFANEEMLACYQEARIKGLMVQNSEEGWKIVKKEIEEKQSKEPSWEEERTKL